MTHEPASNLLGAQQRRKYVRRSERQYSVGGTLIDCLECKLGKRGSDVEGGEDCRENPVSFARAGIFTSLLLHSDLPGASYRFRPTPSGSSASFCFSPTFPPEREYIAIASSPPDSSVPPNIPPCLPPGEVGSRKRKTLPPCSEKYAAPGSQFLVTPPMGPRTDHVAHEGGEQGEGKGREEDVGIVQTWKFAALGLPGHRMTRASLTGSTTATTMTSLASHGTARLQRGKAENM